MQEGSKTTAVIVSLLAVVLVGAGVLWFVTRDTDNQADMNSSSQQMEQQTEVVEEQADIVALASDTESLSTLVSAVQAASLVETLQGDGPFTVFAPTNQAFSALPAGTLDTLLLPENKEQLQAILTYHVVSGNVMASDLSDGQEITTVQGEKLRVKISGDMVYIVDSKGNEAMVEKADVKASNGVVHIINGVLLPQ